MGKVSTNGAHKQQPYVWPVRHTNRIIPACLCQSNFVVSGLILDASARLRHRLLRGKRCVPAICVHSAVAEASNFAEAAMDKRADRLCPKPPRPYPFDFIFAFARQMRQSRPIQQKWYDGKST